MAQGPSNNLLECAANEWYLVRRPYDASSMSCSMECPGDWLTTTSDGLNWCFEPQPPTTETIPPKPEEQMPGPSEVPAEEVAVARPKSQTPIWVFGAAAVAAVFALAAVMSSRKYEQPW